MSRTHYSVSVQGRIGMAGNMGPMMVVHTAAWVGHCRIPICTHLQVPTIGCCSQRPRCMEVLVVGVHAIVTAVYLDGNPTQTHESSHRQDCSGSAVASAHGPGGALVHDQRTVLAGEPCKLAGCGICQSRILVSQTLYCRAAAPPWLQARMLWR
jgi:hypothetical protein